MRAFAFIFFFFAAVNLNGQRALVDSLQKELGSPLKDTNRVKALASLSFQYQYSKPDSAFLLAQEGFNLSEQLNYPKGSSLCLNRMANATQGMGNTPRAMAFFKKAYDISEKNGDAPGMTRTLNNIANLYAEQREFAKAIPYLYQARDKINKNENAALYQTIVENLGDCYLQIDKLDSAQVFATEAYALSHESKNLTLRGDIERILGDIQAKRNQPAAALDYYRKSLVSSGTVEDFQHLSQASLSIARLFGADNQQDSSVTYARMAIEKAQEGGFTRDILNAASFLADFYQAAGKPQEALTYFRISTNAKDSLFSQDKLKQMLALDFEEKMKQQEIDAANRQYESKVKIYLLLATLAVLLIVAIIVMRSNRQKHKAYVLLERQKKETDEQKTKAEQAFVELKSTQAQLVHAEKMASLGELTAGIAHEIQNPLNFVNNFSELNMELIDELQQERSKLLNEKNEEVETELLSNIRQNLEKIAHHGNRADSIVKGMLQHSRTTSGLKEPTDINQLVDEYLRLSFHGLRAKEKSFNAKFESVPDPAVGKINVVAQDIGRVILNLINNAFYAVNARYKSEGGPFEPTVIVTTLKTGDEVQIIVRDNGMGIPPALSEKIFQPFFSTKPTGEGTGLGLSLSYDIIKSHGGRLTVESVEKEYTEFTIHLPV